jgi:hypothetical protein
MEDIRKLLLSLIPDQAKSFGDVFQHLWYQTSDEAREGHESPDTWGKLARWITRRASGLVVLERRHRIVGQRASNPVNRRDSRPTTAPFD